MIPLLRLTTDAYRISLIPLAPSVNIVCRRPYTRAPYLDSLMPGTTHTRCRQGL